MQVWSGFTGFKLSEKTKVCTLFTEHTQNIDADKEKFKLPEIAPDGNRYWPEAETDCINVNKRKLYFFPHAYLPSVIFCMQPLVALRAGILFIFHKYLEWIIQIW